MFPSAESKTNSMSQTTVEWLSLDTKAADGGEEIKKGQEMDTTKVE